MIWLLTPRFNAVTCAAMCTFCLAAIDGQYVVGAAMVFLGTLAHTHGEDQ